jgi:hypothetical protein
MHIHTPSRLQTDERLFRVLNRKLYCWIDKWHGMTMQDIRDMEDRAARELAEVCMGMWLKRLSKPKWLSSSKNVKRSAKSFDQ